MAACAAATRATVTPPSAPTVLLVDDHQVFGELLGDALAAAGMEIVGLCGTLAEAPGTESPSARGHTRLGLA